VEAPRRVAVVDASPCITLARVDQLGLLPALFDEVLVPYGVVGELMSGGRSDTAWSIINYARVIVVPVARPVVSMPSGLSQADREVITLALERHPNAVVIDDRTASRFAVRMGLRVVGTLGVVAAARRRGLIEAARPLFGQIVANGFHAHRELVDGILADLGEEPLGPP
jgi:uncharacterized protein